MTTPIRIGLLGSSWIAGPAIIEPARDEPRVVVTRVASRNSKRAADYARSNDIPGIAVDYAALVTDPEVDLVYVALPPSEHSRWTIAALEAGKHVLCEKPFAVNAAEAMRMVDTATTHERMLIEAWHYRFHPFMHRIEEVVRSGILGTTRHARAVFHAPLIEEPGAYRLQSALGGGALLDTGGYTIHVLRSIFGREPAVVEARSISNGDIDLTTQARLDFSTGLTAEIDCAIGTETPLFSELVIEGSTGKLTANGFPLPQWGCNLRVETAAGTTEENNFSGTTYATQLAHVIAVLNGETQQLTGGRDAVANMRVIDAIRAKAG